MLSHENRLVLAIEQLTSSQNLAEDDIITFQENECFSLLPYVQYSTIYV